MIVSLGALANASRLALFRLLVRRGPEGYTPGQIGEQLGIAAPTLSFHLKALSAAGLIDVRRDGRNLHYSANFEHMNHIVQFLTEHCCSLAAGCPPGNCAPIKSSRRKST